MHVVQNRRNDRRMLWIGVGIAAAWWLLESLVHALVFSEDDFLQQVFTGDRHEQWMRSLVALLFVGFGIYADRALRVIERSEQQRTRLRAELEASLTKVLGGFLPICGYCKKIRTPTSGSDGRQVWKPIESYLSSRTDLKLSHSVCPECMRWHFPDAAAER